MEVTCQADELIEAIRHFGNCIVAFSGGVDSGVVAAAAFLALWDKAVAITGVGPAVSQADLEAAKATAAKIGIRHILLNTEEIHDPNYQRNDGRRAITANRICMLRYELGQTTTTLTPSHRNEHR